MNYGIIDHKHRSASWVAGRSASVKGCRFNVNAAKALIEKIQLNEYIEKPDLLPENFDEKHREWREALISEWDNPPRFTKSGEKLSMSNGMAAKIINVYLKAIIVCGGYHNHEKAKLIHPPIDRLLLKELADRNIGNLKKDWRHYQDLGWSKFTCEQYEQVIDKIKIICNTQPLWTIERYWKGHQ